MRSARDGLDDSEAPGCRGAHDRLAVERVSEAEARADAAVPAADQRARVLAPGAEAREAQRARVAVRLRVRLVGSEVAPFIQRFDRRKRELVPDAEVEGQVRRDLPVVLEVPG